MSLPQVEKKTMEKKTGGGGGNQAKVVTFSHDVTCKHFSHKRVSVSFWEGRAAAMKE